MLYRKASIFLTSIIRTAAVEKKNVSMYPKITGLFVFGATAPQWARAYPFTRYLVHT